jgi:hypothetical protein
MNQPQQLLHYKRRSVALLSMVSQRVTLVASQSPAQAMSTAAKVPEVLLMIKV